VLDAVARLKVVEERMADHQQRFGDVTQALRQFESRVDARFASVDMRFVALEQRVDAGFAGVHHRFDALGREMATQFRWTVGLMLTGVLAIVAALLSQ
jgi:hypothetical protein